MVSRLAGPVPAKSAAGREPDTAPGNFLLTYGPRPFTLTVTALLPYRVAALSRERGTMPALPIDTLTIHTERKRHLLAADKITGRIASCNQAVRVDLAHGRPAGAAFRQLAAEVDALREILAGLRMIDKLTGVARQPAA